MKTKKKCPVCENQIIGRVDKVFCSLECKRAADYEKRRIEDALFFKIDKQLKTNRKILKKYNRTGMTTLRREVLHKEGFNPNFFTHYWKNKKEEVYLFSYDLAIHKLKHNNKDKYVIVEWQDYMNSRDDNSLK